MELEHELDIGGEITLEEHEENDGKVILLRVSYFVITGVLLSIG
jgi:hypothetical protein